MNGARQAIAGALFCFTCFVLAMLLPAYLIFNHISPIPEPLLFFGGFIVATIVSTMVGRALGLQPSNHSLASHTLLRKRQDGAGAPGVPLVVQEPARTEDGYVLVDRSTAWSGVAGIGCMALFWNAVTWGVAVSVIAGGGPPGVLAFLSIFMLIGVGLAVATFRRARVAARFAAVELVLSRWPLRLGEPAELRLRCRLKGDAALELVSGTLTCREWVRYRRGTDTTTVTEELWLWRLPAHSMEGGPAAIVAWQPVLPAHLPPSFAATNNRIEWLVEVQVAVRRGPRGTPKFALGVAPEVAG